MWYNVFGCAIIVLHSKSKLTHKKVMFETSLYVNHFSLLKINHIQLAKSLEKNIQNSLSRQVACMHVLSPHNFQE